MSTDMPMFIVPKGDLPVSKTKKDRGLNYVTILSFSSQVVSFALVGFPFRSIAVRMRPVSYYAVLE